MTIQPITSGGFLAFGEFEHRMILAEGVDRADAFTQWIKAAAEWDTRRELQA